MSALIEDARSSLKLVREFGKCSLGSLRLAPWLRPRGAGPVRIAFQAYSTHLAQLYRSIAARLAERPDTELSFILLAHPQFPAAETERLREYAREALGIAPARIRRYHEILWERYDLVVYTDVYARFPLRRTRHCLLTHGPLLGRRFVEPSRLRKSAADFDVVAVNGRYDYDRLTAHFREWNSPPRLACVGFPYLDGLDRPGVDRRTYLTSLSLDPGARTVLLAPHWKTLRDPAGAQRFERLLAGLREFDGNVVVKPHACSLVRGMAGGVDWRARLSGVAEPGRVGLDLGFDDLPALAHADVLVTGTSSRSLIFMQLGKPVVAIDPDFDASETGAAERRDVIRRGAHIARTPEEVAAFLQNPLAPKPGAAAVAALCLAHPGRATERFMELIEEILPSQSTAAALVSIGTRLDASPRAFGRPLDSTPVLGDAAELIRRMAEDGYLYLRGFFARDEILAARRDVAASLAARGLVDPRSPADCVAVSRERIPVEGEAGRFPAVRRILYGDRLLDLHRRLLGGEARHHDHSWLRLVNPGQATGPHCDIVYMGRGTRNLFTSWVPLGDVPLHHGALMILEGSHRRADLVREYLRMDVDRGRNWRRPRFRHGRIFRGGDYSRNPRAVQRQFGQRWLTTDYAAGDLVIMGAQTMHGSLDNTSDVLRLSADTRYQLAAEPADERWTGAHPIGHVAKR